MDWQEARAFPNRSFVLNDRVAGAAGLPPCLRTWAEQAASRRPHACQAARIGVHSGHRYRDPQPPCYAWKACARCQARYGRMSRCSPLVSRICGVTLSCTRSPGAQRRAPQDAELVVEIDQPFAVDDIPKASTVRKHSEGVDKAAVGLISPRSQTTTAPLSQDRTRSTALCETGALANH